MLINQVYPSMHMCYVVYIVSIALGTIFYSQLKVMKRDNLELLNLENHRSLRNKGTI